MLCYRDNSGRAIKAFVLISGGHKFESQARVVLMSREAQLNCPKARSESRLASEGISLSKNQTCATCIVSRDPPITAACGLSRRARG